MKFGGTSVGSVEALKRVSEIIASCKGNVVVVTSAMSGITNFLEEAYSVLPFKAAEVAERFEKKHLEVAEALLGKDNMSAFLKEFESRMKVFTTLIQDDSSRLNDPYYMDNVISQGERFSSLLLSHQLILMGKDSAALTSEDCGIRSEGRPMNGHADLRSTEAAMGFMIRPYLDRGCIPVITGFYGVMENGKPLTFGRGGSDYSAAVIANALNADLLEIWTDVDGFMSADPRIVKSAVKIEEMNYGEAAELAYFGAKVLHPRTIEPIRMKHIPLRVRNSFRPEDCGTLVSHLRRPREGLLRSIAAKTDLSIISFSSSEMAYHPDIVSKILSMLSEEDVTLYSVSTSLSTVAFLIHNNDVRKTLKKFNGSNDPNIERIDIKSNVALISCVGDSLLSRCGVSAEIFAVVKDAHASVQMISEGASDVSLNFVVPMGRVTDIMRMMHARFIEGGQPKETE